VTTVHAVLPDGIDDPARPSGGNVYDRHVCRGLASLGWAVQEHPVRGFWRRPDATSFAALGGVVQRIPDGAAVLLDGLVASTAPEVLVPHARRLRLVVLVHMPLGDRPPVDGAEDARSRERAVLSVVTAIVTTSAWTRRRLLELYRLPADRVHVARPAVEAADLASGTPGGGALLCVAPVTFDKGHDVLLDALASISDLGWRCVCVGRLDRDRAFAERVRRRALDGGLRDRVQFPGPRIGAALDQSYASADVMVLPSRFETFGMVVIEALARGLPVVATDVGGLTEALGHGADGTRPGLLVVPGDPAALAAALRAWLSDPGLRRRLRGAAGERRASLAGWAATTSILAGVLTRVLAGASA
jgi:glycosyltransferase involved in cell wall biosynthesis